MVLQKAPFFGIIKVLNCIIHYCDYMSEVNHYNQDDGQKTKRPAESLLDVYGNDTGNDEVRVDGTELIILPLRDKALTLHNDGFITGSYALPNTLSSAQTIRFELNVDFDGASIEPLIVTIPAGADTIDINLDTTLSNQQAVEWLKAHSAKKITFRNQVIKASAVD